LANVEERFFDCAGAAEKKNAPENMRFSGALDA
jgi:hypothetical protein